MLGEESRDVLIFGTGEIAEVVNYYLSFDSTHKVVAFVADEEFLTITEFCGRPVIPRAQVLKEYPTSRYSMFVATGYAGMNQNRRSICAWARLLGYQLISYVSPRATVYGNLIHGDNCLILEDNTVQPFVTLGNNVFLWSGNHIGHHSTIEDDVFVSSHCVVSGNCFIGQASFLGVNCTIQNDVRVGASCFVGPRSLLRNDLPNEAVVIDAATPKQKILSPALKL